MGRFNHEAVALDPRSGVVFLAEDRIDDLIFRFLPSEKGRQAKGGILQPMVVKGNKSCDTRNWTATKIFLPRQPAEKWPNPRHCRTLESSSQAIIGSSSA